MGDVTIRTLCRDDLQRGFLESLDALRRASDMPAAVAADVFEGLAANPDYVIAVAEIDGRIVGASTLLIEQKFIHRGGKAGHIEDVAVANAHQGAGVGRALIEYLLQRAADAGCYKTILDCAEEIRPFYEKLGFNYAGSEMRFNHS